MADALHLVGWNQLMAAGMALTIWLFSLTTFLRRRPALRHGLWLLVLLKLITPPAMSIELPPAITTTDSAAPTDALEVAAPVAASWVAQTPGATSAADVQNTAIATACCAPAVPAATASAFPTPIVAPVKSASDSGDSSTPWRMVGVACVALSLGVTAILWSLVLRQFVQMRRWLRSDGTECRHAAELLHDVAQRFGMTSDVALRVVDASVSPLLWAWPGQPTIVLPKRLVQTLDDDSIRSIIAHELAHLTRRDHWTNLVAFAVASIFWWSPIVWFARRRLLASSEACCDALALERLKGSRKSYAATLLTVVDSLKDVPRQRPALAMTFGDSGSLRTRFELLSDGHVRARTSRGGWLILAAGMFGTLFVPVEANQPAVPASTPALATFCCPDRASANDVESEKNSGQAAPSTTSREQELSGLNASGLSDTQLDRLSRAYKTFSSIGYFVEGLSWKKLLPLAQPQVDALLALDELVWGTREIAERSDTRGDVDRRASEQMVLGHAGQMVKLGFFTPEQAAFVTQRQLSNEQFRKNALLHDPFLREQLNVTLTESQKQALIWKDFDTAASEILSDEQWERLEQLTVQREPPAGPPKLELPKNDQLAQVQLSETFKRIEGAPKALNLSEEQLALLHELERLTRLGLYWIDQREPSSEQADARKKFLYHAEQVALLGILTPEQRRRYSTLC